MWQYSESMDGALQDVFDTCVEKGINLFDSAEVYGFGRSEYLCGKFKREFQGPDVSHTEDAPTLLRNGLKLIGTLMPVAHLPAGSEGRHCHRQQVRSYPCAHPLDALRSSRRLQELTRPYAAGEHGALPVALASSALQQGLPGRPS